MWDYKITRSNLWFNIYRKEELKNWMIKMEWLCNNWYSLNRDFAKTFYHYDDAVSGLVIARVRWDNLWKQEEKPETETKVEKQSWSEL